MTPVETLLARMEHESLCAIVVAPSAWTIATIRMELPSTWTWVGSAARSPAGGELRFVVASDPEGVTLRLLEGYTFDHAIALARPSERVIEELEARLRFRRGRLEWV